jgi:hypothetical protein
MKTTAFRYIAFIALAFVLWNAATRAQNESELHPMNAQLERLYPRGFKMPFPEIPRISALQALKLYETQKGFFVHVGESGPDLIGSVRMSEYQAAHVDYNKLAKAAAGKVVVAYCY